MREADGRAAALAEQLRPVEGPLGQARHQCSGSRSAGKNTDQGQSPCFCLKYHLDTVQIV